MMKEKKSINFNLAGPTLILLLLLLLNCNLAQGFVSEITLSNSTPRQGELLKVVAPLDLNQGQVIIAERSYNLAETEEGAIALIPISYWYPAGEYTLTIADEQDNQLGEKRIEVKVGDFAESHLTVDEENEEKVRPTDPERQARQSRERELVQEVRSQSSLERLWEEEFIWPLEGRITTGFGATRYHNGQLANRHSGIDIAAVEGTPIKAVNRGQVVLARNHLTTGKTIIIDHGWNVFSTYLHSSELKVAEGDVVEQGETIALVGETGFATGPHLHWSMSIGNIFVDPEDFVDLEI